MIVNESKSMFYSNYKAINVSKCENRYLKALSPLTEQIDAIKDVSLIKDVSVFYAEGSSTKHLFLLSLA